jgi:hypothetical protein
LLFAMCTSGGRIPAASSSASTERNRRTCSRLNDRSSASEQAKWLKTPATRSPFSSATPRMPAAAVSQSNPSRCMPVSTFTWTSAARPRRSAAADSSRAKPSSVTHAVIS